MPPQQRKTTLKYTYTQSSIFIYLRWMCFYFFMRNHSVFTFLPAFVVALYSMYYVRARIHTNTHSTTKCAHEKIVAWKVVMSMCISMYVSIIISPILCWKANTHIHSTFTARAKYLNFKLNAASTIFFSFHVFFDISLGKSLWWKLKLRNFARKTEIGGKKEVDAIYQALHHTVSHMHTYTHTYIDN